MTVYIFFFDQVPMFQALSHKLFHVLSTKKKRYDLDVIETVL